MSWLQLSPAFILACILVIIGQLMLSRTVYGRYLVGLGTNTEVMRMSGIRTLPFTVSVFEISGFFYGLAGWSQSRATM